MAKRDRTDRIAGDWDRVFDALADPSRRFVLEYLADRDAAVAVRDLAVALAVRTTDVPARRLQRHAVDQAEVGLVHVHLPKLEAADLVVAGDGDVTLTDHARRLPLFTPSYRGVVRPRSRDDDPD